MNLEDFAVRLNAEWVSNKLQAFIAGKHVTLATLSGADWEYTPAGQALINEFEAPAPQTEEVETPPAKLTRSGKPDARYK